MAVALKHAVCLAKHDVRKAKQYRPERFRERKICAVAFRKVFPLHYGFSK